MSVRKYILKLIFIPTFLIQWNFCYTQKNEVDVVLRYGISERNMKMPIPNNFDKFDYQKARTLNDVGAILTYSRVIWEKAGIFLSCGFEFSSSTHYQQILEKGGSHLDNIVLRENRNALRLGLTKQTHLFDSKIILEFGFDIVKRNYSSNSRNYSRDFYSLNDNWIEFKYDLKTYHDGYYENDINLPDSKYKKLNSELFFGTKFKTGQNSYFNFKFNYSRNNVFFYDFKYSIQYFENGSANPTNTYTNLGLQEGFKYVIRDHFWYLAIGYCYKF